MAQLIPAPPLWLLDSECYTNYFLVMIRNVYSGEVMVLYERFNDVVTESREGPAGTYITFNGNNYDMPMLSLAGTGASNATLKEASDAIITKGRKPWDMARDFGYEPIALDHIDLIEVAPGQASLKIYGGRLHSNRLQDLPLEPSATIQRGDVSTLRIYCANDLVTTGDLYKFLKPQLELREAMSAEFGIDLRSKSDAQIAEAVIRSEVEKQLGRKVYRQDVDLHLEFKYNPPPWVTFATPGMQHMLELVKAQTFTLRRMATADNPAGSVVMPAALAGLRVRIGQGVYRMGIGGLHSSEKCVSYVDETLIDRDVTSYYPSLILNANICPPAYGDAFPAVYRSLLERRVRAKREGNKVISEALKIVLNGTFGKLGSMWSMMYAPDQMIAVTLTGQLALLMLIEMLEGAGVRVVSANTDGVVSIVADNQRELFEALIASWEMTTGFNTEETQYLSLFAKDVNNYVAVKADGTVKLKGEYATAGIAKNTSNPICVEALVAHIQYGEPIDRTIRACTDVRKFVTIRKVNGGAVYDGQYLGKAVRWYYAVGESRHIAYQTNGNKVPKTDGARPLMELPDALPADLDYAWYVNETISMLGDIGA